MIFGIRPRPAALDKRPSDSRAGAFAGCARVSSRNPRRSTHRTRPRPSRPRLSASTSRPCPRHPVEKRIDRGDEIGSAVILQEVRCPLERNWDRRYAEAIASCGRHIRSGKVGRRASTAAGSAYLPSAAGFAGFRSCRASPDCLTPAGPSAAASASRSRIHARHRRVRAARLCRRHSAPRRGGGAGVRQHLEPL